MTHHRKNLPRSSGLREVAGFFVFFCVCVCHTLVLRVFLVPFFHCSTEAGACDALLLSHATKLWRRVGRETWPVSCTCDATVDQAVPLSAFCFMVFHDTPPKPFPPQQRCSLSRFVTAVKGNNHCSNTYNSVDFSPYGSIAILPNVATESN